MATLVLTTVGSAIGGPIGGAIGAVIGQSIDRSVLGPKSRQGPRLDDLKIQTSTYGARLPQLFGRVRVAGQVIWATDLVETRRKTSNGKGRGSTETYSYAASFAVALSTRAIVRVERIWADGKLLRGVGGDLKTDVTLRVHPGDEDQAPDPLIASAEGSAKAPAYRGTAYAVFEAMQLADYGNRIPSLSFEVVADEGPVGAGTVIGTLAGTAVPEAGPPLVGLAATGDDARAVADTIGEAVPLLCRVEDGLPVVRFAPVAGATVPDHALGASVGNDEAGAPRLTIETAPLDTTAAALTLSYIDATRDYQPGLQRARREGPGLREERIALPATLDATAARRLAEDALARRGAERMTATATLGWAWLGIRPGDLVTIEGRRWRVTSVAFERMVVRLSLSRWIAGSMPLRLVDAGRLLAERDQPPGATTLALLDLPPIGDTVPTRPQVAVFAAGASSGWRRAALLASVDGGATFVPVGTSALPATIGRCASVLGSAIAAIADRINSLDVVLLNDAMLLEDADDAGLLGGANRAMVGDELIQFARAEPLGQTVGSPAGSGSAPGNLAWRLSGLWRGRGGTEDAIAGHGTDERFVLLDADAALVLPPELATPGVTVIATGIGDSAPWPSARAPTVGRALRPLSPVELRALPIPGGDTELRWTRRSRGGWGWSDAVDAPLAEEREAYRVTRTIGDRSIVLDTTDQQWTYGAAMRTADGADLVPVVVAVSQVGAGGVSPAAMLTLPARSI